VDQDRVFGRDFGGVMIYDNPIGFIDAAFEAKVADPGASLLHRTLAPIIKVIGFQTRFGVEHLPRQPLQ
jgi:hypothetical protein